MQHQETAPPGVPSTLPPFEDEDDRSETGIVIGRSTRPPWVRAARALRDHLRTPPERAATWVEPGWPKAVPALMLLTAPLVLSGPLRSVLSLHLGVALALAVVLTAALAVPFWPWLRAQPAALRRPDGLGLELLGLLPVAFAVWALWDRNFDGFSTVNGWDAGSHVAFRSRFVTTDPGEYHGFVSLYSLTYWIERAFSTDAFHSFRAGHYLNLAAYASLPALVAFPLAHQAGARLERAVGLVAALAATLVMFDRAMLPLFAFNQGHGYFSHLFGILPLALLWVGDAFVRHEALRLSTVVLALGLTRYTYGLNLPDTLVAAAGVVLLGAPRGGRIVGQGLLALALAGAGAFGYVTLRPRFDVFGGIVLFNTEGALAVHLGLILVVGVYVALRARAASPGDAAVERLIRTLRFPLLFAIAVSAAYCAFKALAPKQYYYITKYQMMATFLLAPALVVVVTDALVTAVRHVRGLTRPRHGMAYVTLVCALLAIGGGGMAWRWAYAPYRSLFLDTVYRKGPDYKRIRPLVDQHAVRRIREILAVENKKFGGYLAAFFPMFSFMNAQFRHHTGVQEYFGPRRSPGHCVFWIDEQDDLFRSGWAHQLDVLRREQVVEGDFECDRYTVPWKTTPHSLCRRCF
jgi:hypothetical protein